MFVSIESDSLDPGAVWNARASRVRSIQRPGCSLYDSEFRNNHEACNSGSLSCTFRLLSCLLSRAINQISRASPPRHHLIDLRSIRALNLSFRGDRTAFSTLYCMMAARHCSSWSDFQPELLGLVLRRLPSLADRVRLRAVCRQWRHHALLEPLPPPLPWLTLLDGTFLSVPDGEVHRLHAPDGAVYNHGSTGNWLFYSDINGICSLANPFSKAVIQLLDIDIICSYEKTTGARRRYPVYLKWVLLSSLEPSTHSHFAVLIMDTEYATGISICQQHPMASAFRVPNHERILDAAFFDGKLYALSRKKLFVLDSDSNYYSNGKPKVPPMMRCIVDSIDDPGTKLQSFACKGYTCMYWGYLAECNGRLLHVRRLLGVLSNVPENNMIEHARTLSFDVFEADLTVISCGKWKRVKTLGGQALFVGRHSKCLPASEYGAHEDCIYFICDYDWGNANEDPFRDCGVFNMRNGMVTPLLAETAVVRPQGTVGHPAWFFPEA